LFLRLFEIRKLPITSNGSRSVHKFDNTWGIKTKFRKLSFYKKSNAGRNDSGRIIIRTKSSFLHKFKSLRINYHFRYNKLAFIASFQIIPFKNKLLSLLYFANGAVSYYTSSQSHRIFSYVYLNTSRILKKTACSSIFFMLWQIKKLTHVSLIELIPGKGAQYARSNGAYCKPITFNKETHTVLVQLPSTVKKLFSYYSFTTLGPVTLPEQRKFANSKSGYWRSFGIKPIVRGVAMNPVDHPHGGRTKSVKYPRTPWGKTTKFK